MVFDYCTVDLQRKFGPIGFGPDGFDYSWGKNKNNKLWDDDLAEQVRVAGEWLSHCGRTETINRSDNSYVLKH